MIRFASLLMALVLASGACTSSSTGALPDSEGVDSESADEQLFDSDQPGPVEAAGPPGAGFCDAANQFVTSSDVRLITAPDAALFARLDAEIATLLDLSPTTVFADLDTLRDGFGGVGDAYAAVGFDPDATLQLPPELPQSNGTAVRSLENYLIEQCALDDVRAEQIAQIGEAFGIDDAALAECFHAQMGDVANLDPSSLTPELMTTEVCGTSILGLLSGAGSGESG